MRVLIAIHSRVAAWTIPQSHVDEICRRFPHLTFIQSRDRDSDIVLARDVDVVFALNLSKDAVEGATRLKWLHCSAHAVGHFPLGLLAERGVIVTNSRGIQSTPIAEHVMGALLALSRRLPMALQHQQQRLWRPNDFVGDASPRLIAGQTMAIVGMGTLGQAVAERAKAFGMRVIGVRRFPERVLPTGFDEAVGPAELASVLAIADVIVLAAPWTSDTDRILDAPAISHLRRGAIVVNVARGQLLDESALTAALGSGALGGAILDVFATEPLPADSSLWSMPNVLISAHTAGFRAGHFDAVINLFSENLRRFERHQSLVNVVDVAAGY